MLAGVCQFMPFSESSKYRESRQPQTIHVVLKFTDVQLSNFGCTYFLIRSLCILTETQLRDWGLHVDTVAFPRPSHML